MISKEFQENIESGDVMLVRCVLSNDLIIDRTFKKFNEEFEAARKKMDLLEPYDKEPFETDSEKWDMEYLSHQKVALIENFSEERIAHLQEVIAKVMPPVTEKKSTTMLARQTSSGDKTEKPKHCEEEKKKNKKKSGKLHGVANTISKPKNSCISREKIDETIINARKSSKKKSEIDMAGNALIIGGIATTTAGIALAQPVVAGTGVIATGAGVCIKVYNRR